MKNDPTYRNAHLRYHVTPLRDEQGRISPHFLSEEFASFGITWEQAMSDPTFAQIIEREVAAERIAHVSFEHLGALAPNDRIRTRYLSWVRFIDEHLEPWTTGGAIHFRSHWARVLMIALVLGDEAGLSDTDLDALAMAAVFHDSRRKNPYLDTGHGLRASEYYRHAASENGATSPLLVFDPRTFLAIRWHDRNDGEGMAAFTRAYDLLVGVPQGAQADVAFVYQLFKDADGLDRVRLGLDQLDIRFLRTQSAKDAVNYARELLEASFGDNYTDM